MCDRRLQITDLAVECAGENEVGERGREGRKVGTMWVRERQSALDLLLVSFYFFLSFYLLKLSENVRCVIGGCESPSSLLNAPERVR